MNERIKELADQAEDYATAEYEKWTPTPDFSGIPHIRKIFNKKFAELIVWEAIGLCKVDVDALTGPFLSEYEKGIVEGYRRANKNLRFYFGVEE